MQKCQDEQSDTQPIRVLSCDPFTLRQINNEDPFALQVLQSLGLYVSRITSGARIVSSLKSKELERFNNHPVVSLLLPVYDLDDVVVRQLMMIANRRYEQLDGRSKIGRPLVVPGANTLFFAQDSKDCHGIWRICLHSDIAAGNGLEYIPPVSLDEYTHRYLSSHSRQPCSDAVLLTA